MFYCFLIATAFLMLASPFLLRSRRSTAATARFAGVFALILAACLRLVR